MHREKLDLLMCGVLKTTGYGSASLPRDKSMRKGRRQLGWGTWGFLEAVPGLGLKAPHLGRCVCVSGGIHVGPWGLLTHPVSTVSVCPKSEILQPRPPSPHSRWALRVPWDPFDDSTDRPGTSDVQLMGKCFLWAFSLGRRWARRGRHQGSRSFCPPQATRCS